MARSKRKQNHHGLFWIAIATWFVLIVLALVTVVFREAGWIIATTLICGLAFVGGRKSVQRTDNKIHAANAAYGHIRHTRIPGVVKDGGYLGGSLPPASITQHDAVSAYPAELIANSSIGDGNTADVYSRAKIRQEVSSALSNLGWPASATRESITAAIAILKMKGTAVTTESILTHILRSAGERKAKRINGG